jgi:glycosyltransferase involved in cell wall biosynthesis
MEATRYSGSFPAARALLGTRLHGVTPFPGFQSQPTPQLHAIAHLVYAFSSPRNMPALRILHVYKDFDPPIHGGIEKHIALMCRYQQPHAQVRALVCSREAATRTAIHEGIPLTLVGEWGRFQSAPLSPAFPWHLWRAPEDVIVIHTPNPTAEIGWLLTRPRGRMVVRYHSDVVRQAGAMRVYGPVLMNFLRGADIILPTSARYVETSPWLREVRDACVPVPLGIEPERFAQADPERVSALRKEHGGDFVFFCGMHRYYKGLRWLVEAAPRIGAKVVIAGGGPGREALMRQAAETGVHIAFPGPLSHEELVAHLHACAVFVFPSVERSEAFGISILEAHAAGRPVVATRLGTGVEYANEDGHTGINVPPRDAAALADAVNALLANAPRRAALGEQARQRVTAEFDVRRVAMRELELYQQVLDGNRRAAG